MGITIQPNGGKVKLADLDKGSLFLFNDDLCFKSEYRVGSGAIEAFIVGTGEMFWGATSKPEEQVQLMVQPVKLRFDSSAKGSIDQLIYGVHQNAIDKGWYEEPRTFGEIIALVHSELSEALEDYRAGRVITEIYFEGEKPCGIPIELADVLIRIFDTCGYYGIDLEEAVMVKMQYNATRERRHGGKKL